MLRLLLVFLIAIATHAAEAIPAIAWAVPTNLRMEPVADSWVESAVSVRASAQGKILSATADCGCIQVTTPLPMEIAPEHQGNLRVRALGLAPGMKRLTIATTLGRVSVVVQVVSAGLGHGRDVLTRVADRAKALRATPWLIVHDLGGAIRNCGCSSGALGGLDHLAGVSAAWRETGGPAPQLILTGHVEGAQTGIADALASYGWRAGDPAVSTLADDVGNPAVSVVVTSAGPAHVRVVPPPPMGGMAILAVLCDASGNPLEHHLIPVDDTLPPKPDILTHFPRPRTIAVEEVATETSCRPCHQEAHSHWSASGHAKPWAGLPEADRVDECLPCHITRRPGRPAMAGVSCIACHPVAEAHAQEPIRAPGQVAGCQTCHDGRHDPGFEVIRGLGVLMHGDKGPRSGEQP